MATKEVDEVQWASAQNVVRTVQQILQDPKRRTKLLELQKEAQPDAVIPEIDARRPVEEALEGVNKKIDTLAQYLHKDRTDREKNQQLEQFKQKYEQGRALLRSRNYDEEGIKNVEKLMEDRGIFDHGDAMVVFERLHPPPTPISSNPFGGLNFLEQAQDDKADDTMKRLLASKGEDEVALNRMIDSVRQESRGAY